MGLTLGARSRTSRRGAVAALLLALLAAVASPSHAQPTPRAEPAPERVQELLSLLADPEVREWIARQQRGPTAETPPAAPGPAPVAAEEASGGVQAVMARRLAELRAYVRA